MEQPNRVAPDADATSKRDEAWEHEWRVIDELRARNAHIDPDEILAEVTAEVEAVRQERYERDEAAAKRRR